MNEVGVIDRFLAVFSRYIDSGFGLISGDVTSLAAILIVIDVTIAALFWAWGQNTDIIQSLDLAFHDIDPEAGLHFALLDAGDVQALVTDDAISLLMEQPPQDSAKAIIRGHIARQLPDAVVSISWDEVTLRLQSGQNVALTLHVFTAVAPDALSAAIKDITNADALVAALKSIR